MASQNIKGITIEIGGDTTSLSKALKDVDSSIKDTQKSLKEVDKLLKVDPGNVELLTQKQKLLSDAISDTKSRLETLEAAQSQVTKGTDEWDGLQREIIETRQKLENLTDQQKEFGSVAKQTLKAAGDKVKEFGGKVEAAGKAFAPVSAAAAALGAASIAAFKEVDNGADTIIKKTGATGDALAAMTDSMNRLATSIPTSFEEAGTAIGEVNTRFGLTGTALEDLSGQFIKFAELNGTDVNNSIDTIQAAMSAFNMDAKYAGDVLNILNKAGQDTGVSMDKLAGDLTSNAAVLQELGFDISASAGFLASLNKNGLDSSAVMTGLKKAMQNATKEGQSMDTALFELQAKLRGASTDTEALQIATELFGAKAAPALTDAIREQRVSFDWAANSVKGWGDSVTSTFDATLDPIDQTTTLFNELKVVGAEIGTTLQGVLVPVLETVRDVVVRLREAWDNLTPAQQEMIVKIGLIVAVISPLLIVLGKVITAIGAILPLLAALASPIGIVVAAIAGLVAIFVTLYNTNEGFRTKVNEVWDAIKEKISGIIETVKQIITAFIDLVKAAWALWGDDIKRIASEAFDYVASYITAVLDGIQLVLSAVLALINGDWQTAWNEFKDFAANTLTNLYNSISEKVGQIKDVIMSKIGEAVDWIKSLPEQALQWGADLISNFVDGIKSFDLGGAISKVGETIADFIGFSEPEKGALSNFHTFAPDMMELFASGIRDNMFLITDQMADLSGAIAAGFTSAAQVPARVSLTNNTYLDGRLIASDVNNLLGEML